MGGLNPEQEWVCAVTLSYILNLKTPSAID